MTDVLPKIEPAVGVTEVTIGAPKVNKSAAEVVEVPAALTTVISTVAATWDGDVAVMELSEFIVKLAAGVAPKFIAVALKRRLPRIVTEVPPAVAPTDGLTDATTGAPKVN